MVRRVANQVHKQATRLLQSGYMRDEPAWYQAVLDHPPLPLPPRAPPSRPHDDTARVPPQVHSKHMRPRSPRPAPIYYIEDDVRRQFFRDHPFEAYRERSLVERGTVEEEHPVRGKEWTRLRQRGITPCSETLIRYIVNLHESHGMNLSQAYGSGVAQFRALRVEQEMAASTGALEAEAYGATFGPTEVERQFAREGEALTSWTKKTLAQDEGEIAARKKWRAIVERTDGSGPWSRGENYQRLWREGVHPNYAPALTEPVSAAVPTSAPAVAQVRKEFQAQQGRTLLEQARASIRSSAGHA